MIISNHQRNRETKERIQNSKKKFKGKRIQSFDKVPEERRSVQWKCQRCFINIDAAEQLAPASKLLKRDPKSDRNSTIEKIRRDRTETGRSAKVPLY